MLQYTFIVMALLNSMPLMDAGLLDSLNLFGTNNPNVQTNLLGAQNILFGNTNRGNENNQIYAGNRPINMNNMANQNTVIVRPSTNQNNVIVRPNTNVLNTQVLNPNYLPGTLANQGNRLIVSYQNKVNTIAQPVQILQSNMGNTNQIHGVAPNQVNSGINNLPSNPDNRVNIVDRTTEDAESTTTKRVQTLLAKKVYVQAQPVIPEDDKDYVTQPIVVQYTQ